MVFCTCNIIDSPPPHTMLFLLKLQVYMCVLSKGPKNDCILKPSLLRETIYYTYKAHFCLLKENHTLTRIYYVCEPHILFCWESLIKFIKPHFFLRLPHVRLDETYITPLDFLYTLTHSHTAD